MIKQQQCQILALAVVAIVAWSSFNLRDGAYRLLRRYAVSGGEDEEHRSLRLNQYLGDDKLPRSIAVHIITQPSHNPADSIFETDVLQRYGSGRVDFVVEPRAVCPRSTCHPGPDDPVLWNHHPAPCLTVNRDGVCHPAMLNCLYPQCKHMITNDEKCKVRLYDVREYYSANQPNTGYLPLGPRLDAWSSFQKVQADAHFYMNPASKRKYAFNAIYSQDTSPRRITLSHIIDISHFENDALEMSVHIAPKWNAHVNSPMTRQMNTDEYVATLLDSVFTLSPRGHNPECFRIFEAVEAGSIPVMVRNDLIIESSHPCRDAMKHWRDAPMLVLDSWADLYPKVEELVTGDPAVLDGMQVELRAWYDGYMRRVVGEFEDFMLDAYARDANVLELMGFEDPIRAEKKKSAEEVAA